MRLGLGTAQFGLDYGISNAHGKVSRAEVCRILARAESAGIDMLDTATLYGDSEAAIGAALDPARPFRIVTKTPVFGGGRISSADVISLRRAFEKSLLLLRRDRIYGLLVHAPADLLKPRGESLWSEMAALKEAGLVEKIGFSAYTGTELDALLARFRPDLVQVPLNPLDQRLLQDGRLSGLKQIGVEVHARSLFLQGLLLMDLDHLPADLRSSTELATYANFLERHNLNRLQGALKFIRGVDQVDVALIGTTSKEQLEECIGSFARADSVGLDFSQVAGRDDVLLNPSKWPRHWQREGNA